MDYNSWNIDWTTKKPQNPGIHAKCYPTLRVSVKMFQQVRRRHFFSRGALNTMTKNIQDLNILNQSCTSEQYKWHKSEETIIYKKLMPLLADGPTAWQCLAELAQTVSPLSRKASSCSGCWRPALLDWSFSYPCATQPAGTAICLKRALHTTGRNRVSECLKGFIVGPQKVGQQYNMWHGSYFKREPAL